MGLLQDIQFLQQPHFLSSQKAGIFTNTVCNKAFLHYLYFENKGKSYNRKLIFTMKRIKWEYLLTVLLSLALMEYGLLVAWGYYWSKFRWSPLGYETCGMEALGILLITYPAFVIGLLMRCTLLLRWRFPRAVWGVPLILCGTVSCAFGKSLIMGILCILTMLILPVTDIAGYRKAVRKEKSDRLQCR